MTIDSPTPEEFQEAVMGDVREPNLDHLLKDIEKYLGQKMREDLGFAVKVYGALCNVDWYHKTYPSPPNPNSVGCSWRFAGGFVAQVRGIAGEDYMDYYCSGGEGVVDGEIEEILGQHGWIPIELE